MKTETRPIEPFGSNLEYLAQHLDYLRSLCALRLKGRHDEIDSRVHEKNRMRLDDRTITPRTVSVKRRRLTERVQVTLAGGGVRLPMEDLVLAHKLDETEKFILLSVLGTDLEDGLDRAMDAMAGGRGRN